MRRLLPIVVALAACNTPTPSLRIRIADGPSQSCMTFDCADVPLACKTWVSIRIIDPRDPTAPYLSQCQQIPQTGDRDLCSIARVDLEPVALPITDLEVQVALYPESRITKDPLTNEDVCPSDTQYDAVNGFPLEGDMTPALGGRAYYRPGDEVVTVTLGCTNLELVNDATCVGLATVHVAAAVDDFDTGFTVTMSEGDRLGVSTGEPKSNNSEYELNPGQLTGLDRKVPFPPAWATDVDQLFTSYACLAVLDDMAGSTTTVTCEAAGVTDDDLTFTGVRLSKASLEKILNTVTMSTQFPPLGITIGIVLDSDGDPLPNQVVTVPVGTTIQYLSSDRNSVVGTSTSGGALGGVWVSTDAPFGTVFSTSGGIPNETPQALGGRISNKVTVVVLKFTAPVVGTP